MKPRILAGYACVAAGFALIIALGIGAIDPIGVQVTTASGTGLLAALAPTVLIALALFLTGLWLLKGRRAP